MINVALMSHSPWLAGAERMLFNLALILKTSKKYNPIVYIPKGPCKDLEKICLDYDIEYRYIEKNTLYIFVSDKQEFSKELLNSIEDTKKQIINDNIQLIVNNTATSVMANLIAAELGIPIIGWIHGVLDSSLIPSEYNCEDRLFFDRVFIELSDKVLCCSEWTKKYYNRFNEDKIETLHNWTQEAKEYKEIIQDNVFTCLNTFDEHKGIFVLLEAASILKKSNIDFKVVFYGDGSKEMKEKINKYIIKNDLSKEVVVNKRTNDISSVYSGTTCLIQPSFIEPFGMTIIEAMAHKRPVIVTKSGGPEEIVKDKNTGFLIKRDDPYELAEKMKYIIKNKEESIQMGENGYKIYNEKFSENVASEKILKIIKETLEQYRENDTRKLFIYDTIVRLLEEYKNTGKIHQNNEIEFANYENINSELLSFSKSIKNKRRYNITLTENSLSNIGLIFASQESQENLESGILSLNIYYKKKLLRNSKINIENIVFNHWTYFNFKNLEGFAGKIITLELCFDYKNDYYGIGVYEDKRKRNIIYKIFNRLRVPLKGLDALYIDCK